jgi:hypothetical protein
VAITRHDIATALTCAPSRDIAFTGVMPEAFAASLRGILPPELVGGLLEDDARYPRGEAAEVTTTVVGITGHPAGDIGQFARDNAAAFSG